LSRIRLRIHPRRLTLQLRVRRLLHSSLRLEATANNGLLLANLALR